jgi:hypothetical protein
MIPLISGAPFRLSPDQQKIVATWASLKAMVAEYAVSESVTTHHMQRKYLMDHCLPPKEDGPFGLHIIAPILWSSSRFLVLPNHLAARRPNRRATYYNGVATTQIIGQLIIHVIRSPHPRLATMFRFHLPEGQSIFRIWPPTSYTLTWPVGTIDDASAGYIAEAMRNFLSHARSAAPR